MDKASEVALRFQRDGTKTWFGLVREGHRGKLSSGLMPELNSSTRQSPRPRQSYSLRPSPRRQSEQSSSKPKLLVKATTQTVKKNHRQTEDRQFHRPAPRPASSQKSSPKAPPSSSRTAFLSPKLQGEREELSANLRLGKHRRAIVLGRAEVRRSKSRRSKL